MNLKKLFVTAALALGLGVGAVAGISAMKQAPVEANAEASSWAAGKKVYIRNSADGYQASARVYVNYQDTSNNWHQQRVLSTDTVSTKGSESLLEVELEYSCKLIQIHRTANKDLNSLGNDDHWQWTNQIGIETGTHNLFIWDNLDANSGFGNASAGVAHVQLTQPANGTISVKDHNGSSNGEGYYYSDWTLDFTASAESPYYFDHWTYKSGENFLPFLGEDRSTNPNSMSNLEGEIHFSAVMGDSSADCNTFQNTYLHMNDEAYNDGSGLCDAIPDGESKDRYYLAKDAYNALHSASKSYFSNQAVYAAARARLSAWAIAHGETFEVSEGIGSFSTAAMVAPFATQTNESLVFAAIALVAALMVGGGFVLLRKKKQF